MAINILILSVGSRNKIVRYFKQALYAGDGKKMGNVVAADMSRLAPALYEADAYYIVPAMTTPDYMEHVLGICKKEDIRGVFSLIDPELSLLAQYDKEFAKMDVTVIGSSYELCEMSLDKMKMYDWLSSHDYHVARSYGSVESFKKDLTLGLIDFPVFVKPIKGSASIAVRKADNLETVELLLAHDDGLMVQGFLDGQEIGADVYIDMVSGEVVSIFTKRKIMMRAGETDKAVSFKNTELFDFIEEFVKAAGYRGQIDIDLFEIDGMYYISEVNPRFGGGYPHAYECGCDHMSLIVKNLEGKKNQRNIGDYDEGIYMMKYSEMICRNKVIEVKSADVI